MELLVAGDGEAVLAHLHADPGAFHVFGDGGNAVGLLDAELGGIANVNAFGGGAQDGQGGNFVDQGGCQSAGDLARALD